MVIDDVADGPQTPRRLLLARADEVAAGLHSQSTVSR